MIERRYLQCVITITPAMLQQAEIERQKQIRLAHTIQQRCGLKSFRALKYARRAYPIGWRRAVRDEIRELALDMARR